MLKTVFDEPKERPFDILCLGAHSDDIEIGCGGTILRLLGEFPQVRIFWVVFSANGGRAEEAQNSADLFLAEAAEKHVLIKDFRDGYFPYNGAKIKDYFEELNSQISPDLIFTHYRNDRHQDHRLIEELTWNTFRDHLILEYEIPKYDGDLGRPNYYVCLDGTFVSKKVHYLHEAFVSQRQKHWFSDGVFEGLMRLRGVEARSPGKFAEGFYAYKVVQ
jgi:LmbE family N-acetylglucosaminyl deacetylase